MIDLTDAQREHLRELVAALRGGQFRQAQSALRRGAKSYCCLGVGCEISGLGQWNSHDHYVLEWGECTIGWEPLALKEHYGLDFQGGLPGGMSLMRLNDSELLSFEQIADRIESELLS